MTDLTDKEVMNARGYKLGLFRPTMGRWYKPHPSMPTLYLPLEFSPTTNTDDALELIPDGVVLFMSQSEDDSNEPAVWSVYMKYNGRELEEYGATLLDALCEALMALDI